MRRCETNNIRNMRKKEREQSYFKKGSRKERETVIFAVMGGKEAFPDWSRHGNGWHLVYGYMIVFCVMGFCVSASQHLEMFVGVCVCACA